MQVLRKLVDALSSFGLTIVVFAFLFVITLLGTIYQETTMSLYEVQKLYFESWYIAESIGFGVHVPLPGGLLLLIVLAINLICGGIVRLKRTWTRGGILTTHVGIAFLLLACLVKLLASEEGNLALYEGQQSAEFRDQQRLELVVFEPLGDGKVREHTVSGPALANLRPGGRLVVRDEALPFVVELHDFLPNARVRRKGPMFEVRVPVVDGWYLHEVEPAIGTNEINLAGCYATVKADGAPPRTGILWAYDFPPDFLSEPWTVEVDGAPWGLKLRGLVRELPFSLRVEDFEAVFHPGSGMPREFRSDVTVLDGDAEVPVRIEMNAPLRRDGYVLYQSNWGPQQGSPGRDLYTVFAVVRNPSDSWPIWACVVIGVGLLWHFGWMLVRYVDREQAALRKEES